MKIGKEEIRKEGRENYKKNQNNKGQNPKIKNDQMTFRRSYDNRPLSVWNQMWMSAISSYSFRPDFIIC